MVHSARGAGPYRDQQDRPSEAQEPIEGGVHRPSEQSTFLHNGQRSLPPAASRYMPLTPLGPYAQSQRPEARSYGTLAVTPGPRLLPRARPGAHGSACVGIQDRRTGMPTDLCPAGRIGMIWGHGTNPVGPGQAAEENSRVIDRDEIDATSRLLGVNTSNVQRDYLYGWLLAGLHGDGPLLRGRLVLKGGNAFRKATSFAKATSWPLASPATSTPRPRQGSTPNSCCAHSTTRAG